MLKTVYTVIGNWMKTYIKEHEDFYRPIKIDYWLEFIPERGLFFSGFWVLGFVSCVLCLWDPLTNNSIFSFWGRSNMCFCSKSAF